MTIVFKVFNHNIINDKSQTKNKGNSTILRKISDDMIKIANSFYMLILFNKKKVLEAEYNKQKSKQY